MYQLREKILPIVVPSMVEAENFSDHPRTGCHSNIRVGLDLEPKMSVSSSVSWCCYSVLFVCF